VQFREGILLAKSRLMGRRGRVRIGCSGWQYKHWRGNFYPEALPQNDWFAHYASIFDTVEINNSFGQADHRSLPYGDPELTITLPEGRTIRGLNSPG
jgi:uncharacterized protein DUF72